jgi:hypothetical protein
MGGIRFRLAGIVFSANSDQSIDILPPGDSYRDFVSRDIPEVAVCGHYNGFSRIPLEDKNKVFASGVLWDIYREESRCIFVSKVPSSPSPYSIAVFNADFKTGDVYFSKEFAAEVSDGALLCPLAFPFFHLLMISFLAQHGYGVLIHACGIDDNGRGYLFPGSSTHGKTTMARLWENKAVVLNDERVLIRQHDSRLWIYGTPWHGEYENVSPRGVPLEKIFFLKKSEANKVQYKKGISAASALLTHCFLPYWNRDGMNFIMEFCATVTAGIPSYELGFTPDKGIIDFVRCVK